MLNSTLKFSKNHQNQAQNFTSKVPGWTQCFGCRYTSSGWISIIFFSSWPWMMRQCPDKKLERCHVSWRFGVGSKKIVRLKLVSIKQLFFIYFSIFNLLPLITSIMNRETFLVIAFLQLFGKILCKTGKKSKMLPNSSKLQKILSVLSLDQAIMDGFR